MASRMTEKKMILIISGMYLKQHLLLAAEDNEENRQEFFKIVRFGSRPVMYPLEFDNGTLLDSSILLHKFRFQK